MINDAPLVVDDYLEFEHQAISSVQIIARVVAIWQESFTRVTLHLNDNTGSILAYFNMKETEEVPVALKNFLFTKNCYVRLMGVVRTFKNDEKVLLGVALKPID